MSLHFNIFISDIIPNSSISLNPTAWFNIKIYNQKIFYTKYILNAIARHPSLCKHFLIAICMHLFTRVHICIRVYIYTDRSCN